MAETQTIDYDALAKQNGAMSSQPAIQAQSSGNVDYDSLARQHGAVSSTPTATAPQATEAATAYVSAAPPPTAWQRVRAALPIIDRAEYGLQTGLAHAGLRKPSMAEVLAKPPEAMDDDRAIAPERLMTAEQQHNHPIATGAAEFAGGMSTPGNMLMMGMMGGPLPAALARPIGGYFALRMAHGAWNELPAVRQAWDRGDTAETERLLTHVVLGGTLSALGVRYAAKGEPIPATDGPVKSAVYEGYRKVGRAFDDLMSDSATLDDVTQAATGLYHQIQRSIMTHQEVLRNDGARTIQDAITADKAASMNTNRGSISTAGTVAEVSKALQQTGYGADMSAAERAQIGKIVNQPELTLEQAKNLRTTVGRAASKAKDPRWKATLNTAYDQLGEGMKERITELQGTSRPFEHYNNQFKASFELENGIAGKMLESLRGQDRHAAIPKIKEFAGADLSEIQEQMRKMGLDDEATSLDKAQEHAKALREAHDVTNGKYMSGIYRLFMQNPKEAWPGIAVMLAGHGMGMPFPAPQLLGAITASGYMGAKALTKAGRISKDLKNTLPPEYFRTRTEAESPETFTYKDPDEGWGDGTTAPQMPTGPADTATAIQAIRTGKSPSTRHADSPSMTARKIRSLREQKNQ